MIARYITAADFNLYSRNGWKVTYYGERSCVGHCFIASWQCCEVRG